MRQQWQGKPPQGPGLTPDRALDANKRRSTLLLLHKSVVLFPKGQRNYTQVADALTGFPKTNALSVPKDTNVS